MSTKNIPKDQKLYNQIKKEAKDKFEIWPSAYASGWLVKEYKRAYAKEYGKSKSPYTKSKSSSKSNTKSKSTAKSYSSLDRWFKEDWRNVCEQDRRGNYKKCGRSKSSTNQKDYPYCRPKNRVSSKTPKTINEISSTEIQRMCDKKQKAMKTRHSNQKSPSRVYLQSGASVIQKEKTMDKVRHYAIKQIPILVEQGLELEEAIPIALFIAKNKYSQTNKIRKN